MVTQSRLHGQGEDRNHSFLHSERNGPDTSMSSRHQHKHKVTCEREVASSATSRAPDKFSFYITFHTAEDTRKGTITLNLLLTRKKNLVNYIKKKKKTSASKNNNKNTTLGGSNLVNSEFKGGKLKKKKKLRQKQLCCLDFKKTNI